jgi:hypothetical protein
MTFPKLMTEISLIINSAAKIDRQFRRSGRIELVAAGSIDTSHSQTRQAAWQ